MPPHLHLDFETFSKVDLKKVGAYRYAFDPSTEILCAAMALGDGEPVVWFPEIQDIQCDENGEPVFLEPYWDALENPEVLIYAFSAQFEIAICTALFEKTWGIKCPDLNRFRCVQSIARRAALPSKLDTLAKALSLEQQKDNRGTQLIKKFSVMQKAPRVTKKNPLGGQPFRIRPEDDPTAFAEFCTYSQQDVRTEQEVAQKLKYFDDDLNNSNYSLDARINARGVTVNIGALENAQRIIEEETEIVSKRFRELVGCEITQGAEFLKWLHSKGCHLDNLQADTIEEFLGEAYSVDEQGQKCLDALRMKQSVAYAAIKKIPTMLAAVGPHDNRIRGLLTHHAATTGRWGASLVQWQNMKRPSPEYAAETYEGSGVTWGETAYLDICNGISRDMLELCYGPPLEVIASCIRHFVHDV